MITKELQNKLVTRCQNPRTVTNRYTQEPVVSPARSLRTFLWKTLHMVYE